MLPTPLLNPEPRYDKYKEAMTDFDNSMAMLLRKREARQMHAMEKVVPAILEHGRVQVRESEADAVKQYNNELRSRGPCSNQEGNTQDLVVSPPQRLREQQAVQLLEDYASSTASQGHPDGYEGCIIGP